MIISLHTLLFSWCAYITCILFTTPSYENEYPDIHFLRNRNIHSLILLREYGILVNNCDPLQARLKPAMPEYICKGILPTGFFNAVYPAVTSKHFKCKSGHSKHTKHRTRISTKKASITNLCVIHATSYSFHS